MFVIQITDKGAGVAFSEDPVPNDLHMHFWELTFGATDVLFNELVEHLPEVFLAEIPVDDVVGIVLASCLLESGL